MHKLKHHVAVLWRNKSEAITHYDLLSPAEWAELKLEAKANIVVILEAWTTGKCIAN